MNLDDKNLHPSFGVPVCPLHGRTAINSRPQHRRQTPKPRARTRIFVHRVSKPRESRADVQEKPSDVATGGAEASATKDGRVRREPLCFYGGAFPLHPSRKPEGKCPGTFSQSFCTWNLFQRETIAQSEDWKSSLCVASNSDLLGEGVGEEKKFWNLRGLDEIFFLGVGLMVQAP